MKYLCVYHNADLDGHMSAAIVLKWFIENHIYFYVHDLNEDKPKYEIKSDLVDSKGVNRLDMFGFDHGQQIPNLQELKNKYDQIIMCDISFSATNMFDLYDLFGKNFIWIDHHESAIENTSKDILGNYYNYTGIQRIDKAACELTWEYFFPDQDIPYTIELLGMYDSFRHKGTDKEKEILQFQMGARTYMKNYIGCFKNIDYTEAYNDGLYDYDLWDVGKHIIDYQKSQVERIMSKSFPVTLYEINPDLTKSYNFLAVNQADFNPKNFNVDYNDYDGFAIFSYRGKENYWKWTLYTNGKTNVSKIAKSFPGGGGHFGASGFEVDHEKHINILNSNK